MRYRFLRCDVQVGDARRLMMIDYFDDGHVEELDG